MAECHEYIYFFGKSNFVRSNEFQIAPPYFKSWELGDKQKPYINFLLSCNDHKMRSEKPQGREQR